MQGLTGPITHHRCFHHSGREAVARCPECGRFYCRECVTEHDGRVICAGCLAARTEEAEKGRTLPLPIALVKGVAGLWFTWLFFYWLARLLTAIPTAFHDGLGMD